MSLRKSLPPEAIADLHQRLEHALDTEQPMFIIIMDQEYQRLTDAYQSVCDYCVMHMTHHATQSAVMNGYLPEKGVALLMGHKHEDHEIPGFMGGRHREI